MKLTLMLDEGDIVRVHVEGVIRDVRYEIMADPLEKALGPGCYTRRVLMDLQKADYIDSSGISWLIVSHKHFKQVGGCMILHSIPPRVSQVLQFLHMDKVFQMAEDEQAARALALGGKS